LTEAGLDGRDRTEPHTTHNAKAYREIETSVHQIDNPVAGIEMNPKARMLLLEDVDQARKVAASECEGGGDPDQAYGCILRAGNLRFRIHDIVEDTGRPRVKRHTLVGER